MERPQGDDDNEDNGDGSDDGSELEESLIHDQSMEVIVCVCLVCLVCAFGMACDVADFEIALRKLFCRFDDTYCLLPSFYCLLM